MDLRTTVGAQAPSAGVNIPIRGKNRMKTYGKGTYSASGKAVDPNWYIIDAQGQVLGRLASRVASVLRGKHRPDYTPNLDLGDRVIVINAKDVRITGRKLEQKTYFRHTGYLGSSKFESMGKVFDKNPAEVITRAVKGMLPKGPLGKKLATKLRVYNDEKHELGPQNPTPLSV